MRSSNSYVHDERESVWARDRARARATGREKLRMVCECVCVKER